MYCIVSLSLSLCIFRKIQYNLKVKLFLYAWTDPEGSRRLRLSEFLDIRLIKVARLSALRTGRPYLPRKYSWCGRKDYVNKKKIPVTPLGSRTRDLPCLHRTPHKISFIS